MKNAKKLYSMKLHEVIEVAKSDDYYGFIVTRVPGGWIYESNIENQVQPAVFVPFDNGFLPK